MSNSGLKMSLRDMVFTAVFTAVICVIAPFSIGGPVPLSLATFIIYIAAVTLNPKLSTLAVVLYVAIGAAGVPVFSGFEGGFQKIAGLTGGYIIGYILCAAATGVIIAACRKKLWSYPLGMVIGTVLLYTLGTAWFMLQSGRTLAESLAMCVVPFLPGDAVKIAVASAAAPQLRKALERFG